ncbi:hypothetical protein GUJ93_ZPchr0003g17131 [Zizania palustris]|uniref:Uncharacterized protein n=1 Tax=Zizania palustris TaxID=103762 RepID=A0A8J5V715_ZIZPA|nr:hypothetical protein GUJ93_ZPchr0003g17131 [Zizania palustris]
MSVNLKQYEKEHMKMAMLKQEETFKKQVQELHRLYRVQKLKMAGSATTVGAGIRREHEDERHAEENEAGSNGQREAYPGSSRGRAPLVLGESDLELTLAVGSFGTTGETSATKREAALSSSSVDSRTSNSSSSTESGSPHCRAPLPHRPSRLGSPAAKAAAGSNVGRPQQHLEQEALKQQPPPPWLHRSLNFAR